MLVLVALALGWLCRGRAASVLVVPVLVGALASHARADEIPPAVAALDPIPPPPPTTASPSTPTTEPGRDIKTISAAEVQAVRQDKELSNAVSGSRRRSANRSIQAAAVSALHVILERALARRTRYRRNPWITTSPIKERSGVAIAYATLIRRYPMRYDRVNLRTSLHLGVSTLLFDVYGAPKYSTGPYFAISPLGIDYDLGGAVRLVIDPVEFIQFTVPLVGQLPL